MHIQTLWYGSSQCHPGNQELEWTYLFITLLYASCGIDQVLFGFTPRCDTMIPYSGIDVEAYTLRNKMLWWVTLLPFTWICTKHAGNSLIRLFWSLYLRVATEEAMKCQQETDVSSPLWWIIAMGKSLQQQSWSIHMSTRELKLMVPAASSSHVHNSGPKWWTTH